MNSVLVANEDIKAKVVDFIDADKNRWRRIPTDQAMAKARERGFDLVVINPRADPPVCVALDFAKLQAENAEATRKIQTARRVLRAQGRRQGIEESASVLEDRGYPDLAIEVRRLLEKSTTP